MFQARTSLHLARPPASTARWVRTNLHRARPAASIAVLATTSRRLDKFFVTPASRASIRTVRASPRASTACQVQVNQTPAKLLALLVILARINRMPAKLVVTNVLKTPARLSLDPRLVIRVATVCVLKEAGLQSASLVRLQNQIHD